MKQARWARTWTLSSEHPLLSRQYLLTKMASKTSSLHWCHTCYRSRTRRITCGNIVAKMMGRQVYRQCPPKLSKLGIGINMVYRIAYHCHSFSLRLHAFRSRHVHVIDHQWLAGDRLLSLYLSTFPNYCETCVDFERCERPSFVLNGHLLLPINLHFPLV
jgi:hypothetical protein